MTGSVYGVRYNAVVNHMSAASVACKHREGARHAQFCYSLYNYFTFFSWYSTEILFLHVWKSVWSWQLNVHNNMEKAVFDPAVTSIDFDRLTCTALGFRHSSCRCISGGNYFRGLSRRLCSWCCGLSLCRCGLGVLWCVLGLFGRCGVVRGHLGWTTRCAISFIRSFWNH